jgi:hypothetical protein
MYSSFYLSAAREWAVELRLDDENRFVSTPNPIKPPKLKKSYNFFVRLPLSLIGLFIAILPAPFLLVNANMTMHFLNQHFIGAIMVVASSSILGSYLCLRAIIPQRWIAVLCCPFFSIGFFILNAAIVILAGCSISSGAP